MSAAAKMCVERWPGRSPQGLALCPGLMRPPGFTRARPPWKRLIRPPGPAVPGRNPIPRPTSRPTLIRVIGAVQLGIGAAVALAYGSRHVVALLDMAGRAGAPGGQGLVNRLALRRRGRPPRLGLAFREQVRDPARRTGAVAALGRSPVLPDDLRLDVLATGAKAFRPQLPQC